LPRLSRRSFAILLLLTSAVGSKNLIIAPRAEAQYRTTSVKLTWTATGDNGNIGQAAKYDLRYNTNPIVSRDTSSWWNASTLFPMSGKVPPPAGRPDSVTVGNLIIGLKYYAMLRVADAAGNWSSYSNVALMDLSHGVTAVEAEAGAPKLVVSAPYPSPTSGQAQMTMILARSGPLEAGVYDARGRLVRTLHSGSMEVGAHLLRWDGRAQSGSEAATGVYWIRVATAGARKTVKLVVVR
jgi:hypothetical protein